MTDELCRISIAAPSRRLDLAVPSAIPIAEVLPDLVRLSGEESSGTQPRSWVLARLGERPLPPERTLADCGVLDGELLYLRDARRPIPPALVHEVGEVVAQRVDEARWSEAAQQRLLLALGALWLAASTALPLLRAGNSTSRNLALAVALLLVAIAWTWRRRGGGLGPMLVGFAAVPLWASGAADIAVTVGSGELLGRLTAAGLGVAVGGVAVRLAAPRAEAPAAGIVLAGLALAGFAAAAYLGASIVSVAAVVLVLCVVAIEVLPQSVMALAGLNALDDAQVTSDTVPPSVTEVRTKAGHELMTWLLAGLVATALPAFVILAFSPGIFARLLCGVAVAVLLLQARVYPLASQVLILTVGGMAGSALLVAGAAVRQPRGIGQLVTLILVLVTGLLLVRAGTMRRQPVRSAQTRVWLSRLHFWVLLALVPLCLGVLGVYPLALDIGRDLGGG